MIVASVVHASVSASWAAAAYPAVPAIIPVVWLQLEVHYAIMSATIPTLGTFMKSFNTRWGALNGPDLAQYAMDSVSRNRNTDSAKPKRSKQTRSDAGGDMRLRPDSTGYAIRVRASQHSEYSQERLSDASDQMIIRKTVSTTVERE